MSHDQEINGDKGGTLNDNNEFGNEEFELIFRQYFSPLCAHCQYKFGFDIDSAKDAVQAELEGRIGKLIQKPVSRRHLHPGADVGNKETEPKKSEIAIAEGGKPPHGRVRFR